MRRYDELFAQAVPLIMDRRHQREEPPVEGQRRSWLPGLRPLVVPVDHRQPADTIAAMVCQVENWLDRLALHEAAGELVVEIRELEQRIIQVIDQPENRTRITVGPCIAELDDGSSCPGEVGAIIPSDGGSVRSCVPVPQGQMAPRVVVPRGTLDHQRKGAA